MPVSLDATMSRLRERRGLHLLAANLRILLAFAFVPAGLKKVFGEPFTELANSGAFHDFLDAFHATGGFYRFVGVVQLVGAALLITQRASYIGALVLLPVISAILVFCWSTAVYPTASVVTLMFLGTVGLVVWDHPRWRAVPSTPRVDPKVWAWAGVIVVAMYLLVCVLAGEIYRPRRVAADHPAFYVFPLMVLVPIGAFIIDRRRRRRA